MARRVVFILMMLTLLLGTPVITLAQQPVVKMLFFYSPTCSHCEAVLKDFMPGIVDKYGKQLEIAYIDITDTFNYKSLLQLEAVYGIDSSKAGVPELFIGKDVLMGEDEVRGKLVEVVDKYLAQGGVGYPEAVALDASTATPSASGGTPAATRVATSAVTRVPAPTATRVPPSPTPSALPPIHAAYFFKTGCATCTRLEYDLNVIKEKHPSLVIDHFEVVEQAPLYEWIAQRLNVPESERLVTPAIFIGDHYLIGDAATPAKIEALVTQYASGAPAFWADWKPGDVAPKSILDRFKSFGVFAVAGAGLVDGLNPCAFATIIFLVSYLAFLGRKGREILLVGGAFTVGVFITYMAVGLGLSQVVHWVGQLSGFARWVYLAAGLMCIVAAVLSINDYLAARRGKPEEMRLKLPTVWRKQINRVIREGSQLPAFVGVALATGIIVSLIELACTGQIYLPTILYVMSVPAMKARATSYLLLYNVLFIVPLVVVFALAYAGTTSQKLSLWLSRRTSTVKLLTAVVFVGLGVWLLYTVITGV